MADIHIQRIRSALTKLFNGHLDMSNYAGKPGQDREMAFLSRAMAAYGLMLLCQIQPDLAAACVTDGFDDNGLDLICFDEGAGVLYLGQSKWINNGNGSISRADCQKLLAGCRDIVNMRLERFNACVRSHEAQLRAAVESTDVRIVLFLAYSGTQALSPHVQSDIDLFLKDMNDTSEVFTVESFDQGRIYKGLTTDAQRHAINLQILMNEWGHVSDPHSAYYGQVAASSVAKWWKDHGRSLFARNIRYFKGSTDVNNSIAATLREHPEHFWYFNNGITILCSKVGKQILGAPARDSGVFECHDVNIVNGAQTVGMIGMMADSLANPLEHAKVLVRLISLEHCAEGFDKTVTRAANTQNRIESRDFAALDTNQHRLASELLLDGLCYSYKNGDPPPDTRVGCTIVDATVALACAADLALAVQAKREIGRLWEDIEEEPYKILFNDHTNAADLWKAVEIMRVVDAYLTTISNSGKGRLDVFAVHGNRFILYRVFQDANVRVFRNASADMEKVKHAAELAADTVLGKVAYFLETQYPNAYAASFFKNLERCRELDRYLDQKELLRETSPAQVATVTEGPQKRLPFGDAGGDS